MSGWTQERTSRLRVYWTQGFSASEIARLLGGVTRNAVIGKVIRLNLPARAARGEERCRNLHLPGAKPQRRPRAMPSKPREIKAASQSRLKFDGVKPKGAQRSDANIPFITRTDSNCPMFCEGEEGPDGMICGRVVEAGTYCAFCRALVYDPVKREAA